MALVNLSFRSVQSFKTFGFKRDFKRLWICRVNAAAHMHNLSYSKLRNALKNSSIELNLKMLAQIALLDKETFSLLVKEVS